MRILLLLLLLLVGCKSATDPDDIGDGSTIRISIKGKISNGASGGPRGARVEVNGKFAVPDSLGAYQILDVEVPRNRAIMRVTSIGDFRATRAFTPALDSITIVDIQLLRSSSSDKAMSNTAENYSLGIHTLSMPANCYLKSDGSDYIGEVTAFWSYYSVGADPFSTSMLGDNSFEDENQISSYLSMTRAVRVQFLSKEGDSLHIRPGTIAGTRIIVDESPDRSTEKTIYTFDHASARWKSAGNALRSNAVFVGDFVYSPDFVLNGTSTKRAPATITVRCPDGSPLENALVVIANRRGYTDSNGIVRLVVYRTRGYRAVVSGMAGSDVLTSVDLPIEYEGDPGEHTIQLAICPKKLKGIALDCNGSPIDFSISIIESGQELFRRDMPARAFNVPISSNASAFFLTNDQAGGESEHYQISADKFVSGTFDLGSVNLCRNGASTFTQINIPQSDQIVGYCFLNGADQLAVVSRKYIYTYDVQGARYSTVQLQQAIPEDASVSTLQISSNDERILIRGNTQSLNYSKAWIFERSSGRLISLHDSLRCFDVDPLFRMIYSARTESALRRAVIEQIDVDTRVVKQTNYIPLSGDLVSRLFVNPPGLLLLYSQNWETPIANI